MDTPKRDRRAPHRQRGPTARPAPKRKLDARQARPSPPRSRGCRSPLLGRVRPPREPGREPIMGLNMDSRTAAGGPLAIGVMRLVARHGRARPRAGATASAAKASARTVPPQTSAADEQQASRGAVGARLLRGKAVARDVGYFACSRAYWRERACAQPRLGGPRIRVRRLSESGMRIRAGVAPAAARLERSGTGPDGDFARAITDPEPSPQPHRDVRKRLSARVRRYRDLNRSRYDVVYGGAAIEAPRHLWRCSAALLRAVGLLGLRLGLCRTSVARSRSFSWPSLATKVFDLQVFPAMARPGLEPGTPRFSVVCSTN